MEVSYTVSILLVDLNVPSEYSTVEGPRDIPMMGASDVVLPETVKDRPTE